MARDEDDVVEGFDEGTGEAPSDYPLDAVMVRSETRTIREVVNRMDKRRYVLTPDFQRALVWKDDKQSKLIESCLMRIPLPVFYVAEGDDGRVIVVDGLQRLSTFKRFMDNKLRLQGLGEHHPFSGFTFRDLPLHLQERVEDTQITLYILDKDAPERARLDIFERVNSGVPLTRQQMRNALYGGKATRWLEAEANGRLFKQVTGNSLRPETMRDREALNRFCAFDLIGWREYRGDMDGFLALALTRMNKAPSRDLDAMQVRLHASLQRNKALFGRHAFRKSLVGSSNEAQRSILNISLFDVCSVLLGRIAKKVMDTRSDIIRNRIVHLLSNNEFVEYITYSTNNTRQVHGRFILAEHVLGEFML